MLPRVLRWAPALVAADLVDARAPVFTKLGALALVDVLIAGLSGKEGRACANEVEV